MKKFKNHLKSITFDQGSEFNKYQWIKECFGTQIYFCKPASPYQKGAVENGNGVIRAELPRNYDVALLKQKHVAHLVNEINNRPLKCLGYKTPQKCFNTQLANKNISIFKRRSQLSTVLKPGGE